MLFFKFSKNFLFILKIVEVINECMDSYLGSIRANVIGKLIN